MVRPNGVRIVVVLAVLAACHPLPPPPVFAPHAGTQPEEQGAVTAMVVVGAVTEMMGGDGWGIALRIERQQTDRTTIGGEITGGRGSDGEYEDGTTFKQALIGVRAFGRTSPREVDELAMSYGAGLSWMRTGLVTATLSTSFIASRPSETVVPLAALSFALAIPLRHGRAYGDRPLQLNFGEPMPVVTPDPIIRDGKLVLPNEPPRHHVPKLDFYIGLDVGFIVSLGDTGNALSLDLGGAVPVRAGKLLLSASAADTQTF
jgi:hypothetical protein